MKLKFLHLLIICLFCIQQSFGQNKGDVYFLKNSGARVDKLEDADYFRVVEPDSGSTIYNFTEYYKDKTLKTVGKVLDAKLLLFEGLCRMYYPSGKRREIANYKSGVKDGDSYEYYKNGKLYLHKTYAAGKELLVLDCVDSTGKVLLANGNGIHIIYNSNTEFKDIVEQGEVKDGLKNGQWKGEYKVPGTKLIFNEEWVANKLIAGKSVDENGTTYAYTENRVFPSFKGGLPAFGHFLADVVRYPSLAQRNRIQGRVVVAFVVQTDGSLGDFKIKESPDEQMSAEAIRVLKISPKWQPGVFYGKVVPVYYTVPIAFKL
jgi:TonB family protein